MAVKYMKKSKLQVIDGMICNKKGEVLGINPKYAKMFNELETKLQEKLYLEGQPEATPMPSLDGFKRKHDTGVIEIPEIEVTETPTIDKRIEEALAFAEEMQDVFDAKKANDMYKEYALLFEFVENDKLLVNTKLINSYKIDTPMIGNVLTLGKDKLADIIGYIAGVCEFDAKED